MAASSTEVKTRGGELPQDAANFESNSMSVEAAFGSIVLEFLLMKARRRRRRVDATNL